MAQAEIDRRLAQCLTSYKNSILDRITKKDETDLTIVPELMYCLLHFLKRTFQRDLPDLLHIDAHTCHCSEAIHICFHWVKELDVLVCDNMMKHFNVENVLGVLMSKDSSDCYLTTLQKKYHFLCCVAHGAMAYLDHPKQ